MHKALLVALFLTCSSASVAGGHHHHHHSLPPTSEAICDAAGVDADSCQDYIDDEGGRRAAAEEAGVSDTGDTDCSDDDDN